MNRTDDDKAVLSTAEIDMLYAAKSAEIEAQVALARHEMAYQETRDRLMSEAKEAQRSRERAYEQVVRLHGFDPERYEPDFETGKIEPNGLRVAELFSGTKDKAREIEHQRGNAVTLTQGQELQDEQEG